MATIETKVSDLSGKQGDDIETYTFALDGDTFEIDLTKDEYAKLDKILEPYVDGGRRLARTGRPYSKSTPSTAGKEQIKAMKEWLSANGYDVPARGRISQVMQDAYHNKTPAIND